MNVIPPILCAEVTANISFSKRKPIRPRLYLRIARTRRKKGGEEEKALSFFIGYFGDSFLANVFKTPGRYTVKV